MGHQGALRNPAMGLRRRFVGLPTNRAMTDRAERRAMVGLLAVFALLVQALIPAFATAAPASAAEMLICTEVGLQTAPDGAPTPTDHSCKHCLCPAPVSDPSPAATLHRVAYAARSPAPAPAPHRLIPPARAPPRPPGQGPPTSDA